jgi:hypothetical protein
MIQKTNEQGQKVYEVLSEEYIRLKECELVTLNFKISKAIALQEEISLKDLMEQYSELSSHIEDLKAEL